jgi:hypothetical protein
MADPRPKHYTMGPSLLNQPLYNGAANAMYGPRGPARASPDYGGRGRKALSGPPESVEAHVQDAIARVPDLSPKQRLALRNVLMSMTRDVSFARMVLDQAKAKGPWSEAAVRGDDGG